MSKMQTPFILSGGESIVTAYAVEIKRKREIDESIIFEVQSRSMLKDRDISMPSYRQRN